MAFAFLDIRIGEQDIGRVIVELWESQAPKACRNFLELCRGDVSVEGTKVDYRNNTFHRVVRNFMVQAGDLVYGDVAGYPDKNVGLGGRSVFAQPGDTGAAGLFGTFEDENLGTFDSLMVVAMANTGPDTNFSQFFINTALAPHLDGKHTIFGRVVAGKSVVREVEATDVDGAGVPRVPVVIADCGEWHKGDSVPIYNACYDPLGGDVYEEYPDDETKIDKATATAFHATETIKESATLLFKANRKRDALLKYKKALRYCNEFVPDQDSEPEYYGRFLELKKKLFLNMSLTCMQLKDHEQCLKYCEYLLEMQDVLGVSGTELAKTHYRRGVSLSVLHKDEQALAALAEARRLVPGDKAVATEYARVESVVAAKTARQKAKLSKFFG